MTAAIMQPYLFPYLGYYQLVSAVDTFVFFDDVNYINKGWINRNQLLHQNKPLGFTVPLLNASQNRKINEIQLSDFPAWRKQFLKTLEMNYKRAPFFNVVFKWLGDFFSKDFEYISDLACESVKAVSGMLRLPTQFKKSSSLSYKNNNQGGSQKIVEICKIIGADKYINAKNGRELYDKQQFHSLNIELNFIGMNEVLYPQFANQEFVPNLSILDVMMFNDSKQINHFLTQYSLN